MKRHSPLVVLLAAVTCGCGFGSGSVVRIVEGQEQTGRAISPEAYEHFVRGSLEELGKHYAEAESEYQAGLEEDDASPELWTRLGHVRCLQRNTAAADEAFAAAERRDANYGPLHVARARCAMRAGTARLALEHARRAVRDDPDNPQASDVLLEALLRNDQPREALALAVALALRHPAPTAWHQVRRVAKAAGDEAWEQRAIERASEIDRAIRRNGGGVEACDATTWGALDFAIHSDKLGTARSLAASCRLTAGALAVRAAALGNSRVARAQAGHVLSANPGDGDAVIALWVAADLEGEPLPLPPIPEAATPPGPLALRLMAEMLARRAGADAARAWLHAAPTLPPPGDALERELDARLVRSGLGSPHAAPRPPLRL